MKLCQACNRCFPDASRACVDAGHPPLAAGPPIDTAIGETWVLEHLLYSLPAGGSFLARSRKTGQTANLHVRRPPDAEDAESFDLFVRESSLLAGLQEVSIAGVDEFGPLPDGGAYAVAEPAGEETLRDLLNRDGRLSVPATAAMGRQVALAVEALAQAGIAPGEILSDRVGLRPRESGPAVRLVRLPGSSAGGDAGVEVPSLGALLYEMLSGKSPARHAGQPPPPIQRARPDLPESLGWLVMQCLHPSVAARPRSIAEIARRLEPFEQVPVDPPLEAPAPRAADPGTAAPPAFEDAQTERELPSQAETPSPAPASFVGPSPIMPPAPNTPTVATPAAPAEAPPSLPQAGPASDVPPQEADLSTTSGARSEQPEGHPPAGSQVPPDAPEAAAASPQTPTKPLPPPRDSAITAEIPILRSRYSYRSTPPAKKVDEDQSGPRPMFIEQPPGDLSLPPDVPPPVPPMASWSRSTGPPRSAFAGSGDVALSRPHRPGSTSGGTPLMRRGFPPPPAPPPASPFLRPTGEAEAWGEPLPPGGVRKPARQILISAERSAVRPPPGPLLSAASAAGARPAPKAVYPGDSGVGAVTVGDEGAGELQANRKGPRTGVVWAIFGMIAAAVLVAFWLVIEARPLRRETSGPAAARPAKAESEPPPTTRAATSTARPQLAEPLSPAPAVAPAPAPVLPTAMERSHSAPASAARPVRAASRGLPPSAARRTSLGPAASSDAPRPAAGGLRDALDSWIDSTNARDLSGHMRFYLPRVGTFYRTTNVSRDFVRREKARLFQGGPVSIATGEPEIDPSPDGRTATVHFRKRYAVSGPRGEKRGEVVQEMKWIRTREGWRIAAERDAKVLASR